MPQLLPALAPRSNQARRSRPGRFRYRPAYLPRPHVRRGGM